MGNQSSRVEGNPDADRRNTRRSSRSRSLSVATTLLPDRTVGSARDESRIALDNDAKAESWTSETGSEFSASPMPTPTGKSTPCPTELPPPRTMEGARKMLTRLRVVFRNRNVEVAGLVTGLGGECGTWRGSDGGLEYELSMSGNELDRLGKAMSGVGIGRDGAEVVWSQKLLGEVFALLDGLGMVIEDIVELCGKMRKMQTGDRLPDASDRKWLEKNVTPDAVKLTARVKHLMARSKVVRFDIEQENSRF